MKKMYMLLVVALAGSLTVSAQLARKAGNHKNHVDMPSQATQPLFRHAHQGVNHISTAFWSDDFSDTSHWTISHEPGTSGDWVIGTNGPSGPFAITTIASATAVNGFALFDSDLLCTGNQIGNLTTRNPIDCSTYTGVRLSFTQNYKRFFDSTYVYISNDGTNWTRFEVNGNYVMNDASQNPDFKLLDISSAAAGQDSVYIRFQYYSPTSNDTSGAGQAGCGYSWQIDDVSLSDVPAIDASILTPTYSGEYTLIPINQAEAFSLEGRIFNNGSSSLPASTISFNVYLNNISNLVYSGSSSAAGSIPQGDTSAVLTAGPYVPADTGLYVIQEIVSVTGDGDNSNDTSFTFVYVNDSIYGRDYTGIDGTGYLGGFGFNNNTGSLGQVYHVYQASQFTTISFYLDGATLGDQVSVSVYNFTGGAPGTMITSSTPYTISSDDTGGAFITIPLNGPVNVVPGDYFVTLDQLSTTNVSLAGSFGIYTPGMGFFSVAGGAWTPIEAAGFKLSFILRVNNPSSTFVGVNPVNPDRAYTVFPNPSKGIVYIMGDNAGEKNVLVNVLNSVGQVILSRNYSAFNNVKLDLSTQPEGIYTVQIQTSSGTYNKTVVISTK